VGGVRAEQSAAMAAARVNHSVLLVRCGQAISGGLDFSTPRVHAVRGILIGLRLAVRGKRESLVGTVVVCGGFGWVRFSEPLPDAAASTTTAAAMTVAPPVLTTARV
jgi:hypothetical protein